MPRGIVSCPAKMGNDDEHIGKRLTRAREAAGLCVDDVVFRTKLPRSVLLALEAEDFSVFASPLYAKSFLAQYSAFLDVDARAWLDALEPGSFGLGGAVATVVEALPSIAPMEKPSRQEVRGGWVPVLGLFALSTALVVTAVKGFEFFETKFAREHPPVVVPPPVSRPAPVRKERPVPAIVREDENLGKPPPRAIIVR